MSTAADREIVRRFYREAIVECDSSACERLLSTDFVLDGEPRGRGVEFTSTAILRVRDGLIAQAWDEMNSGAILRQLKGAR